MCFNYFFSAHLQKIVTNIVEKISEEMLERTITRPNNLLLWKRFEKKKSKRTNVRSIQKKKIKTHECSLNWKKKKKNNVKVDENKVNHNFFIVVWNVGRTITRPTRCAIVEAHLGTIVGVYSLYVILHTFLRWGKTATWIILKWKTVKTHERSLNSRKEKKTTWKSLKMMSSLLWCISIIFFNSFARLFISGWKIYLLNSY